MDEKQNPQPEILPIDRDLRLRKYDGNYRIAVKWYQDPVVYKNSEGITRQEDIPDEDYVRAMYEYLSANGECYFIEVLENGRFRPIGDVTVKAENLPVVIGEAAWRGRGIGRRVMAKALCRARELGISRITGSVIYDYNTPSQRLHESLGFHRVDVKGNKWIYELSLETLTDGAAKREQRSS